MKIRFLRTLFRITRMILKRAVKKTVNTLLTLIVSEISFEILLALQKLTFF